MAAWLDQERAGEVDRQVALPVVDVSSSMRAKRTTPAQLTTTSSRPWRSTTVATASATEAGSVTSVASTSAAVAGQVGAHDRGPLAREQPGGGRADARGGAGHQGDPAVEPVHEANRVMRRPATAQGVGQVVGQVAHLVDEEAALGEPPGAVDLLEPVAVAAGDDRLEGQVGAAWKTT